MICSACGSGNPDDAVSCRHCGSRAAWSQTLPVPPTGATQLYHGKLGGLADVLTVLLACEAVLWLLSLASPGRSASVSHGAGGALDFVVLLLMPVQIVVFLVWFYRARKNAGESTWPQHYRPGWAIWSWFVPVAFLWIPYRIMAAIWRAGRTPDQRARAADTGVVAAWWACWLLAWVTGFHYTSTSQDGQAGRRLAIQLGSSGLSAFFCAAAAISLVVIIRMVSAGPVSRLGESG